MRAIENTAATHLQADDLRIILDRLEDVPDLIRSGRVKQARDQLGLIRGFTRAAHIASVRAIEESENTRDTSYFEWVYAHSHAVIELIGIALQKMDQGRASATDDQISGAISIATVMVSDAETWALVRATHGVAHGRR